MKNNRINELFQSGALQVLVGECGECIQNWEGEKEVVTTLQTVVKTLKNCALNDVDAKVAICKHSIPKLLVRHPVFITFYFFYHFHQAFLIARVAQLANDYRLANQPIVIHSIYG